MPTLEVRTAGSAARSSYIQAWDARTIPVVRSSGHVTAVCDFADNLIHDDRLPWPPPVVVQKLYESCHGTAFDDTTALTKRLGFYSDLQSLHSEDAITWSYFGPLLAETPASRAQLLNWLLTHFGLAELARNQQCSIDLWRRIPHPDTLVAGGPELDVVLDGDCAVAIGEAKWLSGHDQKQGVGRNTSQLQLRRNFLGWIGPRIYGNRGRVVFGIVLDKPLEPPSGPDAFGVYTRSIRWDELLEYPDHPKRDEFERYFNWKKSLIARKVTKGSESRRSAITDVPA